MKRGAALGRRNSFVGREGRRDTQKSSTPYLGKQSGAGESSARISCQGLGVQGEPQGHDSFLPPPSACRTSLSISGVGPLWQHGTLPTSLTSEKVMGEFRKMETKGRQPLEESLKLSLALRIGSGMRRLTSPCLSCGLPLVFESQHKKPQSGSLS